MRTPITNDFDLSPRARAAILKYQETCHPDHEVTYAFVTLGRTWAQEVHVDENPDAATDMDASFNMALSRSLKRNDIYQRFGLIYSQVTVTASPEGEVTWAIDWDGPPSIALPSSSSYAVSNTERLVGSIWTDLEMFPRPPERIPVWMKAWMATMGGWDIDNDQPMWNDRDLTGTPVDYDTAYTALHAKNPSVLPHILNADTLTATDT